MKRVSIAATLEIPDHWDHLSVRQFLQRTILTSFMECRSLRMWGGYLPADKPEREDPSYSECNAVYHGNVTCRTCRDWVRENYPEMVEYMNRMDEINPEFVAPCGIAELEAFARRLA